MQGEVAGTAERVFGQLDDADLKFTRPSEYLAGVVRALAPDTPYPPDNGLFWFYVQNTLGQLPFYWPTPDGYPDLQSYWASTGGLLNRWRFPRGKGEADAGVKIRSRHRNGHHR